MLVYQRVPSTCHQRNTRSIAHGAIDISSVAGADTTWELNGLLTAGCSTLGTAEPSTHLSWVTDFLVLI